MTFVAFVVVAIAFPPHDLDTVIGDKKIAADAAQNRIVESAEFRAVVEKAIDEAAMNAREKVGPTFAQSVRFSIGKQLAPNPEEFEKSETGKAGAAALKPHPVDRAIGERERPRRIIRALARSPEFKALIERATKGVEELPAGDKGASFGQQVRVNISKDLLPGDDDAERKGEAPTPK